MSGHDVIWTQPPALLSNMSRVLPDPRAAFQQPAILRFTSDSFMPELLALLETSPERIADFRIRRETWRGFTPAPVVDIPRRPSKVFQRLGIVQKPSAQAAATETGPAGDGALPPGTPLKLYQPAHQRHYLVACSLVCRVPGLPDRAVDAGSGEQTGYVLRRLLPPGGDETIAVEAWEEHAWVQRSHGYVWQKTGTDSRQIVKDEERLPLFALQFAENDRRRRRLLAGVIPVAKREVYLGAPKSTAPAATNGGVATATAAAPGVTPRTSRKILLRKEVIEPWKSVIRGAQKVRTSFVGPFTTDDRPPNADQKAATLLGERERIQTLSWLILLDLSKYLAMYLKPVWRAVLNPVLADDLEPPERAVFDALEGATLSYTLRQRLRRSIKPERSADRFYALGDVVPTMRLALARYGSAPEGLDTALETRLENIDRDYRREDDDSRALWPGFLFPLADPDVPAGAPQPDVMGLDRLTGNERDDLALEDIDGDDALNRVDRLAVLMLRALRDDHARPAPEPAVPAAAIQPANPLEGWFRIRCVYDQPACEPLHGPVVSDPTDPFQLAGFFDPDAPARPIRIGLPIDTTPAGLRKFDKNTAMVISNTLCGQIQRFKGITLADLVLSVLPWPFHRDLPNLSDSGPCTTDTGRSLGMMCSLSIPIVTICALILLMIMVSILDYIFKWLPYVIMCFPIPGLSAKKEAPRP